MDRRTFLAGTGAVLLAAPLAAEAQQAAKVPRIGYLANNLAAAPRLDEALRQGLRDLGYVEGRNVVIEYRSAEGKFERQDLEKAFQAATQGSSGALLVVDDPATFLLRKRIVGLAANSRLPAMYGPREFVIDGGLMSVRDKPLAWWEYAVFGTLALGVGVALAIAPTVLWG